MLLKAVRSVGVSLCAFVCVSVFVFTVKANTHREGFIQRGGLLSAGPVSG